MQFQSDLSINFMMIFVFGFLFGWNQPQLFFNFRFLAGRHGVGLLRATPFFDHDDDGDDDVWIFHPKLQCSWLNRPFRRIIHVLQVL